MKKVVSVLLIAVMLVAVLASCNTHEHVFAEEWTFDDDYHWHACTVEEGCKEQSEKAEHDFEVVIGDDGNPVNSCKVCGATNDNVQTAPEHTHEFAEEYSSNNNFHWYACKVEGCYETLEKAEHAFGNPEITYTDKKIVVKRVCVDCAYEAIEEQEVKTEVDNAVSWDDAFKNFKLTNFTMDVHFKYSGSEHINHCVVTEKDAYYCIPDAHEFYTVPNGDGTYTTYERYGSVGKFTLYKNGDNRHLLGAQTETVIQVSFEDNFDKFTYDEATASYVCKEPIEAVCYRFDGSVYRTLYCYNNVVKLTDGKISYIEAEYYFDESELQDHTKSFKYYNIGMSVVEIPQSVVENSEEGVFNSNSGNAGYGDVENTNPGEGENSNNGDAGAAEGNSGVENAIPGEGETGNKVNTEVNDKTGS